ncbi:MAG TPA: tetratricopeptide repeat protein [Armatimonadota bacterium]|jgi:tetratricopeptide (TPR) repeat protein
MRRFPLLTLILCFAGPCVRGEVANRVELCALAPFPTVSIAVSFGFQQSELSRGVGGPEAARVELPDAQAQALKRPEDASAQLHVAQLHRAAGDVEEAGVCFQRAITLARQELQRHPEDPKTRLALAQALTGIGQQEEAEGLLRRLTKENPKQWEPWCTLGQVLSSRALGLLKPAMTTQGRGPTSGQPSEEAAAAAREAAALNRQAMECLDRAVSLAPDRPEPYLERTASGHLGATFIKAFATGGAKLTSDMAPELLPEAAVADLRRAAELSRSSAWLLGALLALEAMRSGPPAAASSPWAGLPEATRKRLSGYLGRLEELSASPEPETAGPALVVLGLFEAAYRRDLPSAERHLRKCLEVTPSQDRAWDALTAMFAMTDRDDALAAVCEERVRKADGGRARLMLAKAYARKERWKDCQRELETALRKDPKSSICHLGLAAALLRQVPGGEPALEAVRAHLEAAKELDPGGTKRNAEEYLVNKALLLAVSGNVEAARRALEGVLKTNASCVEAQQALGLLGFPPGV